MLGRATLGAFVVLLLAGCREGAPAPISIAPPLASRVAPPLAGNASGNIVAFQSTFGARGNFEMVSPSADGGLLYYWRNNDAPDTGWNGPTEIFEANGHFDSVAFAQNGGRKEEIDLVARQGNALVFLWRDSDPQVPWHAEWRNANQPDAGLTPIAQGVAGVPAIVARDGGAIDVVVPLGAGGIAHYTRDVPGGKGVWSAPSTFGADHYDAVTLAKDETGGLVLAARSGSRIDLFERPKGGAWSAPRFIGLGARGAISLVARSASAGASMSLLVPSLNGGIDLYSRAPGPSPAAWSDRYRQLPELGIVDAVGAFESNYGVGNLEIVALTAHGLSTAWRAANQWTGPLAVVAPIAPDYPEPPPELTKSYSEYVGPLSGAAQNDEASVNLTGTDLGPAFEVSDGRLAFLFGDSRTVDRKDETLDSIAYTDATSVDRLHLPKLTWATRASGEFLPFDPPGINGGGMNVPVEGIDVDGRPLFFFSTDYYRFCPGVTCLGRHRQSVLAATSGNDPASLHVVQGSESARFININVVAEPDGYLYVYGSGFYRQSPVYLARVAKADIGDRSLWRYYRGTRDGAPVWGTGELTSVPLFRCGVPVGPAGMPLFGRHDNGIGEFSVRKLEARSLYLMTYKTDRGCGGPNGVHLRTAHSPWGPWSQPTLLLTKADAHGHFVHVSSDDDDPTAAHPIVDDGLARDHVDGVSANRGGSFYGPYLVPRWFTHEGNVDSIVFAISSWNPYQVHLVRSVLTRDGSIVPRPNPGVGLVTSLVNGDFAAGDTRGWTAVGNAFSVVRGSDGSPRVTSSSSEGEGHGRVGTLAQDFVVDDKVNDLVFTLDGGTSAAARLYWRGDLVRETKARSYGDHALDVDWNIADFRGETLQLVLDSSASSDNALTASAFRFR